MRRIILIGLLLSSLAGYSQTCSTITAYDYMETWNWTGDWWIPAATTNFYTNASVSPSASAVLYGTGGGSSANEADWYSMPNQTGLTLSSAYHFKFRLGSYRFTSTNATRGVDVGDFVSLTTYKRNVYSFMGNDQQWIGSVETTYDFISTTWTSVVEQYIYCIK